MVCGQGRHRLPNYVPSPVLATLRDSRRPHNRNGEPRWEETTSENPGQCWRADPRMAGQPAASEMLDRVLRPSCWRAGSAQTRASQALMWGQTQGCGRRADAWVSAPPGKITSLSAPVFSHTITWEGGCKTVLSVQCVKVGQVLTRCLDLRGPSCCYCCLEQIGSHCRPTECSGAVIYWLTGVRLPPLGSHSRGCT